MIGVPIYAHKNENLTQQNYEITNVQNNLCLLLKLVMLSLLFYCCWSAASVLNLFEKMMLFWVQLENFLYFSYLCGFKLYW